MQPVWWKTPLMSASAPSHSSRVSFVFSASYGRSKPDFFTSSSSKWSSATTTLSKFLNWALSARSAFCFSFFWAFFSALAAFFSSDLRGVVRARFYQDKSIDRCEDAANALRHDHSAHETCACGASARRVTEM